MNTMSKVEVLNYTINYEQVGIGKHPILCLPGTLGTIEQTFRQQLSNLDRKEFTIVAWDPPGCGQSRPPNRDFSQGKETFFHDARLAVGFMKKLNFPKFSILGWCSGGITALIIAALFPDSIEKIVVWGAKASIKDSDLAYLKRVENVDAWPPKQKNSMIEIYGEELFRKLWSDCIDCYVRIRENDGGDICMQELSKISCPTLIIHGNQDPSVEIDHPNYLHDQIKNSELIVMEEWSHVMHLQNYKEFNAIVEGFLTKN